MRPDPQPGQTGLSEYRDHSLSQEDCPRESVLQDFADHRNEYFVTADKRTRVHQNCYQARVYSRTREAAATEWVTIQPDLYNSRDRVFSCAILNTERHCN